jgi:hypothetical protein
VVEEIDVPTTTYAGKHVGIPLREPTTGRGTAAPRIEKLPSE